MREVFELGGKYQGAAGEEHPIQGTQPAHVIKGKGAQPAVTRAVAQVGARRLSRRLPVRRPDSHPFGRSRRPTGEKDRVGWSGISGCPLRQILTIGPIGPDHDHDSSASGGGQQFHYCLAYEAGPDHHLSTGPVPQPASTRRDHFFDPPVAQAPISVFDEERATSLLGLCRQPIAHLLTVRYIHFVVSEHFDPTRWQEVDGFSFRDLTYHRALDQGTVRVAFHRPEVRNAFRPDTVDELFAALDHARQTPEVGVVLLTGNGPSPKDGGWAFCSGGDQRIRGADGYQYSEEGRLGRLHILEVQRLIRFMPKIVIAVVPGWAVGGGHSLHVVCDLTLACAEHAIFKQTDPDVASFDGGFGSAYLTRMVGQKRAREIFFLGRDYRADEAVAMGMVNASIPHGDLEATALEWAEEIGSKSPTAQRMLKYAFNAIDDGLIGQQLFAGEATRLAYGTPEAEEGRQAFLEKRRPRFRQFPWHF